MWVESFWEAAAPSVASRSRRKTRALGAMEPQVSESMKDLLESGVSGNSGRQHLFERHKLPRKADCAYCLRPLSALGSSSLELRCRLCKFPAHTKCRDSALANRVCQGIAVSSSVWQAQIQKEKKSTDSINVATSDGVLSVQTVDTLLPIRVVHLSELGLASSTGGTSADDKSGSSAASSAASAASAASGGRQRIVEVVKFTVDNPPEFAKASCGTKTLPVRPPSTAVELEAALVEKLLSGAHPDIRDRLRKALHTYRLYDDSGKIPHRLLPDEKPYGRCKELVFRHCAETATVTAQTIAPPPSPPSLTTTLTSPSPSLTTTLTSPSPSLATTLTSPSPSLATTLTSPSPSPSLSTTLTSVPSPTRSLASFAYPTRQQLIAAANEALANDDPSIAVRSSSEVARTRSRAGSTSEVVRVQLTSSAKDRRSTSIDGNDPSTPPMMTSVTPKRESSDNQLARTLTQRFFVDETGANLPRVQASTSTDSTSSSACARCPQLEARLEEMELRLARCETLIAHMQQLMESGKRPSSMAISPAAQHQQQQQLGKWGDLVSLHADEHGNIALSGTDVVLIGRSTHCDAVLANPSVSSEHCRILIEKSPLSGQLKAYIYDLSTNGTFVNGRLVGKGNRTLLIHNDVVSLCSASADSEQRIAWTFKRAADEQSTRQQVEYEDLGDRIVMEKVSYSATMPQFVMPPKDQPFDRSYNANHGHWLAYISALAYGDPAAIRKIATEYWGFKDVCFFEDQETNTRALGLVHERFVVIGFRGTDSSENWNTNMNISMVSVSDSIGALSSDIDIALVRKIRLHRGFNVALLTVWEEISAFAVNAVRDDPERPLYLTGHSLGGALASIAWLYFTILQPPVAVRGIYTFGQPKPGNKYLATFLSLAGGCTLQRLCNRDDVVPALPPKRPYGFCHCGTRIYIRSSGEFAFGGSDYDPGSRALGALSGGIQDHRQSNYLQATQSQLERMALGSVYRGSNGYKLQLTVVRATEQRKDSYVVVRSSLTDFSSRTRSERGSEPVWNENLEIPEIYYGDELIIEVWSDKNCSGCVILQFYNFNALDMIEFPLVSRPGKKDRCAGSLVLSLGFSPLENQKEEKKNRVLFGTPLSELMEEQQAKGCQDECPAFVARASEIIVRHCLTVPGGFDPESEGVAVDETLYAMLKGAVNTTRRDLRRKDKPALIMKVFNDFLSSLRVPLLGFERYQELMNWPNVGGLDGQLQLLRSALSQLLPWQRWTVAHLCCMVWQLVLNRYFSKCTFEQMAAQLGPYLIFTKHPHTSEPVHIYEHAELINSIVSVLFANWRQILDDEAAKLPVGMQLRLVESSTVTLTFEHYLYMTPAESASPIVSLDKVSIDNVGCVIACNQDGQMGLFNSSTLTYIHFVKPPEQFRSKRGSVIREQRQIAADSLGLGEEAAWSCVLDIGRTDHSRARNKSTTWLLAMPGSSPVLALPSGDSILFSTAGYDTLKSKTLTCSAISPGAIFFGTSAGSVVSFNYDMSTFNWKTCLPPTLGRSIREVVFMHLVKEVWAADDGGNIFILSTVTQKLEKTIMLSHLDMTGELEITALVAVGRECWAATRGGRLVTMNGFTRKISRIVEHTVPVSSFCMLDEDTIALGCFDGRVELWSVNEVKILGEVAAHQGAVNCMILTRVESSKLWMASSDGTISIWTIVRGAHPSLAQQSDAPTPISYQQRSLTMTVGRSSDQSASSPPTEQRPLDVADTAPPAVAPRSLRVGKSPTGRFTIRLGKQ